MEGVPCSTHTYISDNDFFIIWAKSKAPWAAHGWIAQCQVYFCPCGKMSLWAKLLVWKYMSPARSFAWKSSDFHGKRLAQALVLQIETQTVEVKVYICAKRPIRPALIKKIISNNKTIYHLLVVCLQCPIKSFRYQEGRKGKSSKSLPRFTILKYRGSRFTDKKISFSRIKK